MKWLTSPLGGKEMMLHIIIIAVCGSFLSSLAFADSHRAHARGSEFNNVMGVTEDHYKTVINRRPYRVEVCNDVQVQTPTPGAKIGPFDLEGAIIGGIIGNQIGDMKGNGTAGAVIGGLIGNQGGGYTTQQQCRIETRYQEETKTVYSHSTITFWDGGTEYTVKFQR